MQEYLQPTEFLDFDQAAVRDYAERAAQTGTDDVARAVRLYYAVRDDFAYDPYLLDLRREGLRASTLLQKTRGYCVEKAVLLAATARAVGIPSRLSFYIVQNHIATGKIERILRTNKLVFHGAAEMFLQGHWVKATPAFNRALCVRLGVAPLEFDGVNDAVFQQYDNAGNTFMDYLHDYGNFPDLPYHLYLSELQKHYPHLMDDAQRQRAELVYDLN